MKNLRVSMKLIVSLAVVVVLAIAVGIIGIFGMYSINNADEALYNENVLALIAMGSIRETLQAQIVQIRNLGLNAGNKDRLQEIQNTLTSLEGDMSRHMTAYESTMTDTAAEYAYFEGKNLYINDFADMKRRTLEASQISVEAASNVIYDQKVSEIRETMVSDFAISMTYNDGWAKDKVDDNKGLFVNMLTAEIVVLVFSVLVAIFFAYYVSGLISKPLAALSDFMKRAGSSGNITLIPEDVKTIEEFSHIKDEIGQTIGYCSSFIKHVTDISGSLEVLANGDLTVEIKPLSDEDTMGVSLKKMIANLNRMFSEIQASTTQVSTGSRQVADGAQELAQGATEQAASIQELSSSIAEIARKTKENSETAEKTSKLSASIMENAEKGSHQMDDMITAVKEINEASQSISKIIKTIDDIAFQTNILALNAAVEAARAGQHGKGFAVVAEEVRNLASKSAEAAKDTGDMIQNSMEKAELGSSIAEETSKSLNEIVSGINTSSKLIEEIAEASEEQSEGITQINIGIDQVALVTQQNSATAQQSAAASEEMSGQSDTLQQLISRFKLSNASGSYRGLPDGGMGAMGAGGARRRSTGALASAPATAPMAASATSNKLPDLPELSEALAAPGASDSVELVYPDGGVAAGAAAGATNYGKY
ncbi:MAG: methyl-accepting chemotaxis protein [Oscillospiraceae bacterium]|nr:methyl-accepting chemotaxis protein [Oscillospiraceae bacterium]